MNKLKGIILVVSICFASIMMPFNIYADSLPQSDIVGVSWNLIDTEISLSSGGNWYTYTYELEVKLKNKYVGVVDGTLSYTYSDVQSTSSTPTNKTSTTTKRNYVNGDSFKFNVYISNIGTQFTGNGPMYNCSYLINNSTTNVTKYEDLNSIESVVNVLNDIYQNSSDIEGLSTNQLTELQNIIVKLNLGNEYLDIISQLRQWNIQPESIPIVVSYLDSNKEISEIREYNNINYPMFKIYNNEDVVNIYVGRSIGYFVFVSKPEITANNITNRFDITSSTGLTVDYSYVELGSWTDNYKISKIIFNKNKQNLNTINIKLKINEFYIIPIFSGRDGFINVSTDFALQYGFSNSLLDNINKIANGNNASNSASQQLDSDTSDFNTDRDDLIDIEDSMGDTMDSAMNQISPNNNGLSGFGGNFLTSAVWVRTQFERLTNNTPYGSLIVYGMTLGLALLLLGKVML